jgi:outer membrane biosynthesis protein TonB
MIVLGIVLLVIAVVAGIAAIANGGTPAVLNFGVFHVTTSVAGVFISGAVALLLLVVGVSLISSGLSRARRRRREVKALRERASSSQDREAVEDQRPVAPDEDAPAQPAPMLSARGPETSQQSPPPQQPAVSTPPPEPQPEPQPQPQPGGEQPRMTQPPQQVREEQISQRKVISDQPVPYRDQVQPQQPAGTGGATSEGQSYQRPVSPDSPDGPDQHFDSAPRDS